MTNYRIFVVFVIPLVWTALALSGCTSFTPAGRGGGPDIGSSRVVTGSGFVTRRQFAACSIGEVTDIFVEPRSRDVRAAGTTGAAVFEASGAAKSEVAFAAPHQRVSIVPLLRGGGYEYLSTDMWSSPPTLINSDGTTTWTAPTGPGVDDSCAADILGTGSPQVVVSYNGGGGVSLYNGGTKPVWNVSDGNCWHVAAYRDKATGGWRVVHSNAPGKITVRSAKGDVLSRTSAPSYFDDFTLCSWPSKSDNQYVLFNDGTHIDVLKPVGTVVAALTSPDSDALKCVMGCPVRLKASGADYFAVIAWPEYSRGDQSVLSIFDPKGKLVFEEILPEVCSCLTVVPSAAKTVPETLLVGGTDHIWRY